MSLSIYSRPHEDYKLSSGTHETPFTVTFDVRTGGAYDSLLYVRNDDRSRWYSDITITPVDVSGGYLVNSNGFSWKLSTSSRRPFTEEWTAVTAGAPISFSSGLGSSDQGDISSYFQFWVRVQVPRWQPVHANKTVVLRVSATEHLVGY